MTKLKLLWVDCDPNNEGFVKEAKTQAFYLFLKKIKNGEYELHVIHPEEFDPTLIKKGSLGEVYRFAEAFINKYKKLCQTQNYMPFLALFSSF